ncbi:MAG: potassium channel family protein [Thermodesulfobacteriota bacterium]
MRIVITGGGSMGRATAETLVNAGHEVILVEENMEVCERLATELDIMVCCGDATRPDILEKASIEKADLVLALSGNDQTNLITALVAREYGAERVIVRLDDPEFNRVCRMLGVEEIVSPTTATAKHIADMARRPHALEVSTLVGGSLRVFTVTLQKEGLFGKKISELGLPGEVLIAVVERGGEYFVPGGAFKVLEGDNLSIICEEKNLDRLEEFFSAGKALVEG